MSTLTRFALFATFSIAALAPGAVLGQAAADQPGGKAAAPDTAAPNTAAAKAADRDRLLAAAMALDLDALGKIVAANPSAVSDADAAGLGVIQQVARDGNRGGQNADKVRATVAWLLDHGADPNLRPAGRSRSALAIAIDEGDLALVNLLLARGADPNLPGGDRQTALDHVLSYNPQSQFPAGATTTEELFKAVTGKGSKIPFDFKRAGRDGMSPMLSVVMSPLGNVQTLQMLVDQGLDLKARINKSRYGWLRIMRPSDGTQVYMGDLEGQNMQDLGLVDLAVITQNEDLLRYLLSKGLSVNDRTVTGNTPLHYAAAQHSAMTLTLLALHADPNARNNQGETPAEFAQAHHAYMMGDPASPAAMRALLKATDLSHRNRRGLTPLLQAIQSHDTEGALSIMAVYQPVDRMEKAQVAAAQDNAVSLRALVASAPALARLRLPNGRTLLHTAALWQASQAAAVLLKAGADAGARDAGRSTPLSLLLNANINRFAMPQIAIDTGGPLPTAPPGAGSDPQLDAIVRLAEKLVTAGASANAAGDGQSRPLSAAVTMGSTELAGFLIRHGARVNARSGWRQTALSAAKSADMVDLLLAAGADINAGEPTALINALDSGNREAANELIARGADISAVNGEGRTVLMRAVEQRYADVVTLLLNKGAAVDTVDRLGETALTIAQNDPAMTSLLVAHGAKPQTQPAARPRGGYEPPGTPLTQAINRGDPDAVKAAIAADPASVNTVMPGGISPMETALRGWRRSDQQSAMVRLLLDSGADVKHPANSGALVGFAAATGSTEIAQMLLDHGAPIGGRDNNGRTALFSAHDPQMVQFLIAHGADPNVTDVDGNTPLHMAGGRQDVIAALLAAGAKPGIANDDGDLPIHGILRRGSRVRGISPALAAAPYLTLPGRSGLTAFQEMLEMGDPDVRKGFVAAKPGLDDYSSFLAAVSRNDAAAVHKTLAAHPAYAAMRLPDGTTAMHIAAVWSAPAAAAALAAAGADIEARDANGDTPLQWSVAAGRPGQVDTAFVSFLLSHHADPNTRNIAGRFPLQSVVEKADMAGAAALLAGKADPNLRDNSGNSALFTVLQGGDHQDERVALIPVLAAHGADLNAVGWDDRLAQTPLEAAVSSNHLKAATAMIKAGANVNTVTPGGNTALFLAVRSRNAEAVTLLLAAGADVNAVNDAGQTPLDWAGGGGRPGQGSSPLIDALTAHGAHTGTGGQPDF